MMPSRAVRIACDLASRRGRTTGVARASRRIGQGKIRYSPHLRVVLEHVTEDRETTAPFAGAESCFGVPDGLDTLDQEAANALGGRKGFHGALGDALDLVPQQCGLGLQRGAAVVLFVAFRDCMASSRMRCRLLMTSPSAPSAVCANEIRRWRRAPPGSGR